MSESTLAVRKAIRIIAVTWILSMVTTLAVVYVMPLILRPTWHEVATFSGTFQELDNYSPSEVYISSNNWRLYWEVNGEDPPPEDIEFRLFLFSDNFNSYPSTQITWLTQSDFKRSIGQGLWLSLRDGTEYITGSGVFSLCLVGAKLSWEIVVEAYY